MGLLSKLNPFHREWHEPTPLEYEQFMQGFRKGCPLEGEPHVEQTYAGTKQYQRGLRAGRKAYIPGIPYDDRTPEERGEEEE